MDREELMGEFQKIEDEIKEICNQFNKIFFGHGIAAGEQNNFWTSIDGNLEMYQSNFILLNKLLEKWSSCYKGKAEMLKKYVSQIREMAYRVYTDEANAEHIVKKLEELSTKKEQKAEQKISNLLERIKVYSKRLIVVADSLQKLIDELINHSQLIDNKLKSESNLEKLKDEEYRFAEFARKKMIQIGEVGWKLVCKIYSDDTTIEHLFKKIKPYFSD